MHHAHVIEAEQEAGIETALSYAKKNLNLSARANPDLIVLRYGLLSVEDARRIGELSAQKGLLGDKKAIVIAAQRIYNEAQNALLKIFEEPSIGTHLFLIVPSLGSLLPTLLSRVEVIDSPRNRNSIIPGAAETFLNASRTQRSTIAKKLATGKDEDGRRENRDEALLIVNGIETAAYKKFKDEKGSNKDHNLLLREISVLREYLHDRSASVRMILEHLALVTPKDLLS